VIEPFEGINKMPPWKKEEYASAYFCWNFLPKDIKNV